MLPKSAETPKLAELRALFQATSPEEVANWPRPTKDDFMLIGLLVSVYGYIDLNLRRIVDAAEAYNVWKPAKGKAMNLRIGDVEDAVLALRKWETQNEYALKQIKEMRGLRNLVAHFAVKRFPNDDALLFLTRSGKDYKQVTGVEPAPGDLMSAIVEVEAVKDAIKHIDDLQQWLSVWAPYFESKFKAGETP